MKLDGQHSLCDQERIHLAMVVLECWHFVGSCPDLRRQIDAAGIRVTNREVEALTGLSPAVVDAGLMNLVDAGQAAV